MPWPIAHESNRFSFLKRCIGVSLKRPFLCTMRNFEYNSLTGMRFLNGRVVHTSTKMRFLVGRLLHTGTESTLKMSYLGCSRFSFCQGYMVNKRWDCSAGRTAVHMPQRHCSSQGWIVQIQRRQTGNRKQETNFFVRKTLFPVHNAWILAEVSFHVQCTQSFT